MKKLDVLKVYRLWWDVLVDELVVCSFRMESARWHVERNRKNEYEMMGEKGKNELMRKFPGGFLI